MIRLISAVLLSLFSIPAWAETLTLASTTSTQNSGLYDYLLPIFEEETGIVVNVVAVGTGQAIRIAENGDADVLIVHHRPSEDAFIENGFGIKRYDIMYNDYVIVGPKDDPAQLMQTATLQDAMQNLSQGIAPFVSRGDESGTHKREISLWGSQNIEEFGSWYREIGAGMGAALNMAAAIDGYTLSDRGTWLSFGNKQNLTILFDGAAEMLNPYGLVLLNPEKFPHINSKGATRLAEWLVSPRGQTAIGEFKIENAQLFCPNAKNEQFLDSKICPAQRLRK